jgi:hypothetical protein
VEGKVRWAIKILEESHGSEEKAGVVIDGKVWIGGAVKG